LYRAFDLVLSSKIYYDTLAERAGEHLGVDPTHIRLWMMNSGTGNPTVAVKRGINQSLHMILNTAGYSQLNSSQRSNAFYFKVLGISLAELDTMKNMKIT
jgi:ubiquitin carboxyl-terminal hydrolase 7